MTTRRAVALSGSIAAGKSTVAALLSDELKIPKVSFGDYVRSVVAQRGLPSDRGVLQDVGVELIDTLGPGSFIDAALVTADVPVDALALIFDGVRHASILAEIRSHYLALFIFVDASVAERSDRWATRGRGGDHVDLVTACSHAVEHEVESLRADADLVAQSTIENPRVIVNTVRRFLDGGAPEGLRETEVTE